MKKISLFCSMLLICSVAFSQEDQKSEPQPVQVEEQAEEQPTSKKEKKIYPLELELRSDFQMELVVILNS